MSADMVFRDVDGSKSREIVEYLEAHGIVVEQVHFSVNPIMDGTGTLTVKFHPKPPPEQPKRLKFWRRMRKHK